MLVLPVLLVLLMRLGKVALHSLIAFVCTRR